MTEKANIPDDLVLDTDLPPAPNFTPPPAEEISSDTGEPELPDAEYVEPTVYSQLINPEDTRGNIKPRLSTVGLPPLELLYGTLESSIAAINAQSDTTEMHNPEQAEQWSDCVEGGYVAYYRTVYGNAAFERTATREGSEWAQAIDNKGTLLKPRTVVLPVESGERLTGADAVARITNALGMGAILQFPCYHSGIWLTVKAPADIELYELERTIAMEKVALGRMTKGLVFSNSSVYLAGHVINFVLRHIYSTTAPSDDAETLKRILRVQDIPSIVWGMLCAIYPGGYPYRQPCIADVSKCTHISEALLNLGKLQWVDRSKLSEFQKNVMMRRSARSSQLDLDQYQAEFINSNGLGSVNLGEGIRIELESPNIETYESSGYSWVDAIVRATDERFGSKLSGKERSDYITDIARTTAPRQYSHWVKRIDITDKKNITTVIEDRSAIEQSMVRIASVDAIKTTFLKAVGDYIDATSVVIIGYLNYACPVCKQLQLKGRNGERTRIIPIDVMQVFLVLQNHKIDQSLKDANTL